MSRISSRCSQPAWGGEDMARIQGWDGTTVGVWEEKRAGEVGWKVSRSEMLSSV